MSRSKRELTSDEQRLWRRVAATVKRRAAKSPDIEPAKPAPSSVTKAPQRAHVSSSPDAAAPAPSDRAGEKRVRRGKLEIDATLDLHGHTRQTARGALKRFLHAAQARDHRVVVVVTGAGRGGEGVLRRVLPEWLAESEMRTLTSGHAQTHRSHGGAGAFYVFIRRVRTKD